MPVASGARSQRWLVFRFGIRHHDPVTLQIDPARSVLVLLDYQNYNVHPDGYWAQASPGSAERAAPAVARTAEVPTAARNAGITVVHVQNAWRDGHPDVNPHTPWQADAKTAGRSTQGTWGIEFVEALAPIAGELMVRKRALSGFAGMELDRLLHIHDTSTLVIAGIVTNHLDQTDVKRVVRTETHASR
jgi:nicotinamidase-related amidase